MIMSIYGIDSKFELHEGKANLLNIRNTILYRSILRFCLFDLKNKEKNEIVFFDLNRERVDPKNICYINNLFEYKFDNKQIVDRIIKPYIIELNTYVTSKEIETKAFKELVNPLIEYINTLEVEYDFNEELDSSFYSKILGIDFSINNTYGELEKIINIIKIESKVLKKKIFVFNDIIRLLTKSEIEELELFINENNIYLLLIDCIDESEVVSMNTLYIDTDLGSIVNYRN